MPKARLSNDKGLAQSSGNGLQITPRNSLGAGLHYKTVEIDIGSLAFTPAADDDFVAYANLTLPAQSIVVGCVAVATEVTNITTATFSVSLITSSTASANDNITGESDLLAGVALGSGVTANTSYGTFLDTGVSVGTKVNVCLLEAGTNTQTEITSGKVTIVIAYAGVES